MDSQPKADAPQEQEEIKVTETPTETLEQPEVPETPEVKPADSLEEDNK